MLVDGVVLAGGRSRRFGSDKRLAVVAGRSLLETAACKMAGVATGAVFVAGGELSARRGTGLRAGAGISAWLPDDPAGCGPLGGIVAALSRSRYGLLVLACDLPFLRPSTLAVLASMGVRRRRPVVPRSARGWEPLAAFYPRSVLPVLQAALREGVRAPHRVLDRCGALALPVAWSREFLNINRPSDLEGTGS